jgi:ribosomal protein S19
VPLKDYRALLEALQKLANAPGDSTRGKVIRTLVHRIEITPEGFRLHFHVGRDYVEGELSRSEGSPIAKKLMFGGSNTLTFGGR